jgi:anti-sigma regulatory factor (Ser/Thr protein kinase)
LDCWESRIVDVSTTISEDFKNVISRGPLE